MTSIYDLPLELVEDIFSRVPMSSLGAIRSTCKLWNTLPKDPSFKLCAKAAQDIMLITMHEFKVCLMSVNLHKADPFIKQIGKLKQVDIMVLFYCNGLLLCGDYEDHRLVVWNPYTGQTRWIQPTNGYYPSKRDVYCMGYDSDNHHKILRFIKSVGRSVEYEIYDFKTNSWRVLYACIQWRVSVQGVSLKGNSYFITEESWIKRIEPLRTYLLCFDFTRERFWGLPLPCSSYIPDSLILSAIREEKLALLSRKLNGLEMEIWITNKFDHKPNAVSWSYFLKVDNIPSTKFQYLQGSFFVDEEKKIAVIYQVDYTEDENYKACMVGEGGHYKEVDLGESFPEHFICSSYVPSSVQI